MPGIADPDLIRRFVEVLRFPLNILVGPDTTPVERLRELGVARVSVGAGITRATMGLTGRIAEELKSAGTYRTMLEQAMSYGEANRLFESEREAAGG